MATKKEREIIFQKYKGRCAYCGCELTKGWHIDEVEPIRRNHRYDSNKHQWVHDGTCLHPERLHIGNQMPACASCNIMKSSYSLEQFREMIQCFVNSLNSYSNQYKFAKKFGLVTEIEKPVQFYFETV